MKVELHLKGMEPLRYEGDQFKLEENQNIITLVEYYEEKFIRIVITFNRDVFKAMIWS